MSAGGAHDELSGDAPRGANDPESEGRRSEQNERPR